jgi:SPP1 family predicted phage head-tail adaptor
MSLKGIRIGDLDRRLQFENFVETIDPIGNTRVESYTNAFTLWGKIVRKPGGERFESDQQTGFNKCEVMIRYNNLVVNNMRFKDLMESEYFYINDVQKNKREGYCMILAEKRDNV